MEYSIVDSEVNDGWIGAHTHLWTSYTTHFPITNWAKPTDMQSGSFTASDWQKVARPAGVIKAVLVQHSPLYGYDNSYLLDCLCRNPGVFSLIARADEGLPDLGQRVRHLRESGVRGLRISPTIHSDRTPVKDPPNWLKAEQMRNLWTVASN